MKEVTNPVQNSQVEHLELAPKAVPQAQVETLELGKHSRGPWHTDGNEIDSATGDMIGCAYAFYVGGLRPENLQYTPETYANAKLMAAAPELLEALEIARRALLAGRSSDWDFAAVSDAIRRAKGEL